MKKILLLLLVVLVGCSSTVSGQSIEVDSLDKDKYEDTWQQQLEPIDQDIITDTRDFSARLVAELFEDENNIASPLSFYIALSLTIPMAEGDTKQELIDFLGESELNQEFFEILEFYNEHGNLQFANSIWLQKGSNFNMDLMESLSNDYRASIYEVDFTNKNTTKKIMNGWINKMTNNFIKEVEVTITPQMIMSFINTIYLKDAWQVPFEKYATKPDVFHVNDDTLLIDIPFMNEISNTQYVKGSNFQLTSKRLMNGGKVSFVLPDEELSDLINEESLIEMFEATDQDTLELVDLSVPKFDLSGNYDFIPTAKEMGLTLPFDGSTAEIYPYESRSNVHISVIQQQARMTIDEEGIEAAAYTQVGFDESAMEDDEIQLVFNRPFMVIVSSPQGVPLFVGTVVNPSE